MRLPKLKYEFSKAQRSMVQFQGLNLTDSAVEGEYKDTLRMSTSGYPTITQQKSNTLVLQKMRK